MRRCFVAWIALFGLAAACLGAKYHTDTRATEIHTPLRWTAADSAARVGLSVAAADTMKVCLQKSDTSFWMLMDNSPLKWQWVGGKTGDSLNVTRGIKAAKLYADLQGPGTSNVDSLYSTKAVRSADGYFTDDVTITDDLSADSAYARTLNINGHMYLRGGSRQIQFHNAGGSSVQYVWHYGDTSIGLGPGSAVTSILVTPSGTVGIGNAAPAAKLHVTGGARADSLYAGTAGWFKVDTESFPCSLFDNTTFRATATAHYWVLGRMAMITLPELIGTVSGGTAVFLKGLPSSVFDVWALPYRRTLIRANIPGYGTAGVDVGLVAFSGSTALKVYDLDMQNPGAGTFAVYDQTLTFAL